MEIVSIRELPSDFDDLVKTARLEGHRFLEKMRAEWQSGVNRFDRDGEVLFAALEVSGAGVAVGGLNIDPYLNDPGVGRVRHLYVRSSFRGQGIGRQLTHRILEYAQRRFTRLRLRTHNPAAARFYESLGFRLVDDSDHFEMEEAGFSAFSAPRRAR